MKNPRPQDNKKNYQAENSAPATFTRHLATNAQVVRPIPVRAMGPVRTRWSDKPFAYQPLPMGQFVDSQPRHRGAEIRTEPEHHRHRRARIVNDPLRMPTPDYIDDGCCCRIM